MELKKFIKQSLSDIINGVSEAQQEIENSTIVPKFIDNVNVVNTGLSRFQKVDFEITVNVVEEENGEAKLNVMTAIIGGGIKEGNSNSIEYSSKLRFGVPIGFTPTHVELNQK